MRASLRASAGANATALLASALLCASACITVRYSEGAPLANERVKDIVPGVTTRADVLRWFGAPETFSNSRVIDAVMENTELAPQDVLQLPFSDSMVFRFTKSRVKGTVLGVWNRFEVRVTADTLVLFFDDQDRVSSFGYRKGTDELEPAK